MDKTKNQNFKEKLIKAQKEMSNVIDSYKSLGIDKAQRFTEVNTYLIEDDMDKIVDFLKMNGFKSWLNHGYYDGCDWVYVDLNTKIFAYGIPGIKISDVVFNHSITLDEFQIVYQIYNNYEFDRQQGRMIR